MSNYAPPFAWETRSSIWFVTLVVALSQAIDTLVYGLIIPVMPFQLQKLGYAEVSSKTGWLLFAYSLSNIVFTFPISYLSERCKSRKWPLYIGLVALIAALILLMESHNLWMMFMARVLQGASTAVVAVISFSLLCDTVPEEQIGQQLGYSMAGFSLGLIIATPIGGVLYGQLGFRAPFIFGIGAACIDVLGRLLVIEKVDADKIRALLAKSKATEIALEPAATDPTSETITTHLPPWQIWMRLGVSRRPVIVGLVTFLLGTFLSALEPTLPLRAQDVWHLDPTKIGLIFLAATAPSLLSAPLAGWLSDRYSPDVVTMGGMLLAIPWMYPLALPDHLALFIVSLAVASFFDFASFAPITAEFASLTKTIPGVGYADSFGLFNVAYNVGAMVGPVIGGNIYDNLHNGWVVLCGIIAAILGLAMLLAAGMGERPVLTRMRNRSATSQNCEGTPPDALNNEQKT
ncbi:MFS general substrate transporter [Auriculariales sp. MPI-PUGE-AT-0066]|nr:MFS general substrate transporter [Auriculariales sp. MPI-PUGE-AT-0066]